MNTLTSALLLPLLLSTGVPDGQTDKKQPVNKPNIVLIMADDLGYGDVGYNGGPYKTPNLDKLAKKGAKLTQHYSYSVCSPTRTALLTGRYASRFGCTAPQNTRVLPFDTVTLALALRSLGYETGLVGKWHLGSLPGWGPQLFGFDFSYGSLAGGVAPYNHHYKKGIYSKTWHRNGKLTEDKGHVTDLLTREAVAFIEKKRAGPFFLYVPYTAVHLPVDEPQKWLNQYPNAKNEAIRQYGACVTHMDDGVGQILQALKKSGQAENTIVIFLSDNGGSRAQNGDTRYPGVHPMFMLPGLNGLFRGFKGQFYEGGIRTPAIVYWPGRVPSRPVDAPLHVIDWFPTLARVAGYRPNKDLKWDGDNVLPILMGKQIASPRTLYWLGPGGRSTALRHGDWMLLEWKGKTPELYNIARDPSQKTDLARQQPQRIAELQAIRQRAAQADYDSQVKEKTKKE